MLNLNKERKKKYIFLYKNEIIASLIFFAFFFPLKVA